MLKLKTSLAASALVVLTCVGAVPAKASVLVTYVSGKGNDSGNCSSPANPCRTFQFAVNQTAAGGEVKALDPADYRPVTTNKSISITGVDGAGIDTNGGNAITLSIESGAINLANLIIQNVSGSGTNGILNAVTPSFPFPSFSLTITHCTVRGFNTGIDLVGGAIRFLIADTVVTNNQTGIALDRALGTLDHVIANLNQDGVFADRGTITAVDTIASYNSGAGFTAGLGASLLLARSTATTGVLISGGSVISFGDNHIHNNGTDVNPASGTLTNVGTQ